MPRTVSLLTTEIVEAKIKDKHQSIYATLSGTPNNYDQVELFKTISTPFQNGVYWAAKHEYEHDTVRGSFPDHMEIKVISQGRKDVVLGKCLIPRILLTQEQICSRSWFPCTLTEPASGYGNIRFSILYTPVPNGKHEIKVKIIECKRLSSSIPSVKPSPYVIISVLPDPKGQHTARTTVLQNNENPKFNETLTLHDDKFGEDNEVSIFVFGQLSNELDIHGHVRIPLAIIKPNELFEREMPLSAIGQLNSEKRNRSSLNSTSIDSKSVALQEKAILKKFHSNDYNNGKTHKWQGQYAPSAVTCVFCLGLIPKNSLTKRCSECNATCHRVCAKYCVNSCGWHTMLQLNFFKEDIPVYKFENYMRFFKNAMANNFLLTNMVEKNREEASKAFIKVCDSLNCCHEFIFCLLKYEVGISESLGTLFRNNSMCSKSIESFFKYHGMTYLQQVLQEPILEFLKSDLDGELDPTRLENAAEQSPKNLQNLMSFCDKLLNAIFNKQSDFPKPMQGICSDISVQVLAKFSDPSAIYNGIAGFVFLRFFAPAVLGPNLFDLTNEFINEKKKRTLTLAAKTIQNLANLALFGKKEPFMIPMNQFLEPRMDKMKKYLDSISQPVNLREAAYGKKCKKVESEPQLAKIVEIYKDIIERGKTEVYNEMDTFIDLKISVEELKRGELVDYDIPTISIVPETPTTPITKILVETKSSVVLVDELERKLTMKPSSLGVPKQRGKLKPFEPVEQGTPDLLSRQSTNSILVTRGSENDNKLNVNFDLFIPQEELSRSVSKEITPIQSHTTSTTDTIIMTLSSSDSTATLHLTQLNNLLNAVQPEVKPEKTDIVEKPKPSRISVNTRMASDVQFEPITPVVAPTNPTQQTAPITPIKNTKFKNLFSVIETAVATANKTDITCNHCQQGILGEYLLLDGKSFHIDHFNCTTCHKDAKSGAKLFNDKIYCLEHFAIISKDKICVRCEVQWKQGDPIVKALDQLWHGSCFTCGVCDGDLSKGFIPHEGIPYCPEHYKRFIGLVCDGCGNIIDDEFIVINNMKYHKECRKCKVCEDSIANKNYVMMNEHVYCQDHFQSVLKCTRCVQFIKEGEYISIPMRDATLVFHSSHFTCEMCEIQLTPNTYYLTPTKNVRCRQCIFSND